MAKDPATTPPEGQPPAVTAGKPPEPRRCQAASRAFQLADLRLRLVARAHSNFLRQLKLASAFRLRALKLTAMARAKRQQHHPAQQKLPARQ